MEDKLEKIVIIGPIYPYRGGIAHYTAAFYRELKKEYDVSLISYKMQYPRFLFKKPQTDSANIRERIEEARFLLNTANPVNIIRTARYIRRLHPQLLILQWWHPYFAPCNRLLLWVLKKVKTIYICHNVFPHERFPMDRQLTKAALRKGNGFIVQSSMDAEDLHQILPGAKCITAVHPTYGEFDYIGMSRQAAREALGIKEGRKVLLFFGFVREYKGLKHLLRAMPSVISQIPETELWVVGEFGADREEYVQIIRTLDLDKNLQLIDSYVPDEEIQKYFAASDLVVLPYESATQSGVVQIAYGFGRPVIATRTGGLADVVSDGRTGYLVPVKDEKALADAVVRFFAQERAEEFRKNIENEAVRFSWERMREHVEELWRLVQDE